MLIFIGLVLRYVSIGLIAQQQGPGMREALGSLFAGGPSQVKWQLVLFSAFTELGLVLLVIGSAIVVAAFVLNNMRRT